MRIPTERSAGGGGRRPRFPANRIWLVVAAVILLILITSFRGIAGFYTDYLWFKELSITEVWRAVLGSKILLTVVFVGVFFIAMLASLVIADRLAPRFRTLGPEDELIQRYRDIVGSHTGKVRIAISALFALIAGGGTSSQWSNFILFRNHVPFGVKDPQFHKDVGFYVFQLPFLRFLVDWAFVAIVIITFVTIVAHYLNGGIRLPRSAMERVTPQVKAHVSVLLALLALVKAAGYYLQRYSLATSHRGFVDGPTYTDVHAQLPAISLLIFVSIVAVVLFLANIRRQGWLLPGIAVGLWLFLSVVVGAAYPAFIQKFRVLPTENSKERPYIARNIGATRDALGIKDVQDVPFNYKEDLNADGLQANADTIRNVRLWDPAFTQPTFEREQALRSYYQLSDLDVDRYMVNGSPTQVLLSVRDLDPHGLATQFSSWVNQKLQYTHGFGAVVAPANAVQGGKPAFTLQDVPPQGTPEIKQPRIYYGENLPGYAIVGSKQDELDYQRAGGGTTSVFTHYTGKGGVPLGSIVRRLAFAVRFSDPNFLLSGSVTPKSKVIFIRDIHERVRKAAPFLKYDNDPYPVIQADGRMVWVQDAYTTTSAYPYAQRAETDRLDGTNGLKTSFNYVRNSVKIVIDAYNGSMTFYRVDMKDPIAAAYAKAFPKLFTNGDQMSADLRAHLRYPEELFKVQTAMYGRYHITTPNEFFNAGDAWHVAQDAGSGAVSTTAGSNLAANTAAGPGQAPAEGSQSRMDPYYLLTRLPGEDKENFQLLEPFVPASKNDTQKNLTAFMVAKMDPGQYGKLQVYEMPRNLQVDGPGLVDNDINSDVQVSQALTLLRTGGSSVLAGNLLVIPINNSLLWVRPLYVQSDAHAVPEFRKAIVAYAGKVAMGDTLQQALQLLFGNAPPTLEAPVQTTPGGVTTPAPTATVQSLLDQALAAYDAAQNSLKNGDLAGYQQNIAKFQSLVKQARDETAAANAGGSTPPTTAAARSA
jgi:uncharacterized protein